MDWLLLVGSLLGILLGIAGVIDGLRSRTRSPKGSLVIAKGRVISRSREYLAIEIETPEGRRMTDVVVEPPFPMAAMPEEFSVGAELPIQFNTMMPVNARLVTDHLTEYAQQWLTGEGWAQKGMDGPASPVLSGGRQSGLDWYLIPVSTITLGGSGILLLLSILGLAVALHYLL